MENSKARVLMLAVSGVLFGATAFGWYLHSMPKEKTTDAVAPVAAVAPAVAAPQAEAVIATEPEREVYPATSREEAERAARASLRQDPFSGLVAAAPVARAERRNDYVPPPPNTRLIDPPNPNDIDVNHLPPPPSIDDVNRQEEARHERLSPSDVRLVGVIDGKAIFRVSRDAAAEFGLQRSYTVGKGETFGTLEVEKVGKDSATVRDGTSLATKELGPVQ